jgi:hypothetical protein
MKTLLLLLFITSTSFIYSQDLDVANYQKKYQLPISQKRSAIKVDGDLNETAWQIKEAAENFWLKFPRDNDYAKQKTIVKTCYDDTYLYFAVTIYDTKPYVAVSLKRDTRIRESDGFGIVLDPVNKKTNGFYFSVTADNVQADDVMSGIDDDLTFSWDNKWFSATKQYDDRYTIEIAIPFKTLRYDKSNKVWGINFIRSNKKVNEFNTWTRIPVNFRGTDIGYLGALVWDKEPPTAGKNVTVIPYINQSFLGDKVNGIPFGGKLNAGLDAKIAVSQSLNLDLTVNPDFSQVEVDRQVTNLSRFSIFFPERRNFFLENSDLYSNYGIPPIRPFYSRTIGLSPYGKAIPILAGLRLSGNVGNNTRIGILNMQTKASSDYAAQNYTALTTQQRVLKRSSIKAYFLNREGVYTETNKPINKIDNYGRNAGIENSYTSENGKYQAWLGYHHSFKETIKDKNQYLNYGAGYNSRKFSTFVNFDHVGKNYYTDMGFVERIASYWGNTDSLVRNGFQSVFNEITYTIFPKKKGIINQHKFTLNNFYALNANGTFNERSNSINYIINYTNSSNLEFSYENNTVQLLVPTTFTSGNALPIAKYSFGLVGLTYLSDSRKNLVYGVGFKKGNFYNGTFEKYTARVIIRKQPKYTLEINAEYNKLQLPTPYGSANLFLIAPRVEINFATNLFWTTFIQYNTQANNINFNSRLQWRYKPVSDLFLVYTDNYYTDPIFKNKTRAIVLKVNYWLNL